MFIEETFATLITAAPAITAYIGTNPARYFPDTIGSAKRPAIAAQRISDPREKSLRGDSRLGRARVQLTIFATSAKQRAEMIAALRALLVNYTDRDSGGIIDRVLYDDARNQHDGTTNDFMSFVDFIVWHIEN